LSRQCEGRARRRAARAKAESVTLGRPSLKESESAKVKAIKAALAAGMGICRIAREHKATVCGAVRCGAAQRHPEPGARVRRLLITKISGGFRRADMASRVF
jgi:hypothetical protein